MSSLNDKTESCKDARTVFRFRFRVDFLRVDKEYGELLNFILKAAQPVQRELVDFLYPLYVYICLLLLRENRVSDAQKFITVHSGPFLRAEGYERMIKDLAGFKSLQEARSDSYFNKFCDNRYVMKVSKDNVILLSDYLKAAECQVLRVILHLHFHIIFKSKSSVAESEHSVQVPPTAERKKNFHSTMKMKSVKRLLHDGVPKKLVKESTKHLENFKELEQNDSKQKESTALENFRSDGTQNGSTETLGNCKEDGNENEATEIPGKLAKYSNDNVQEESINKSVGRQKKLKNTRVKENGKKELDGFLRAPTNYLYTIKCMGDNVCSVDINKQNSFLACGFESSRICVWNLDPDDLSLEESSNETTFTTTLLGTRHLLNGHTSSVYGLAFTPSSDLLMSCSCDSNVRAWSLKYFETVSIYSDTKHPILDVTVNTNGTYFATASLDHAARLWNFERKTPLRIFFGHSSDVDKVKFHPNGKYIATASADKTVRLWAVDDGREVRNFSGHNARLSTIAFAPNGSHIAAADDSGCINIWDIGSGQLLNEITAHSSRITSLSYNKSGSFIASGGCDNITKVWDAKYLTNVNHSRKEEIQTAALVNFWLHDFSFQYANFFMENVLVSVVNL